MDPSSGPIPTAPPKPQLPQGWSSQPPADLGQGGSPGAWLLVWTIVVVKLLTLAITIAVARSWDAGAILAITSWYWLLVIGLLVAGPVLFRLRLRRARARRAQLLRAEWLLDDRTEGR